LISNTTRRNKCINKLINSLACNQELVASKLTFNEANNGFTSRKGEKSVRNPMTEDEKAGERVVRYKNQLPL
jgi:hypothetical protein